MPVYKVSLFAVQVCCPSVDGGVKMSKNTGASAFRRVDVDQFSEETYEEESVTDDGVNGPNDAEVHHMLNEYPFKTLPLVLVGRSKLVSKRSVY